jgi:fatty-acid desaturase
LQGYYFKLGILVCCILFNRWYGLACAVFGSAGIWAVGVRTFNYEGHGKGEDKRRDGVDYNREDMSINQVWPGYVAGEWHNNHHLLPKQRPFWL